MGSVVVVGSVNLDLSVTVERAPVAGETVFASSLRHSGGGKGANAALACARHGAATTLIAGVGNDVAAGFATQDLAAAGVALHLVPLAEHPTGTALIVVDGTGQNRIVVASGANCALTSDQVCSVAAQLPSSSFGAVLTNNEVPPPVVLAAARLAREHDALLVVNPAPARELDAQLAFLHPILTPNQEEARQLTGIGDAREAASALQARTGAPVVITMGAAGALVLEDGRPEYVGAPQVVAVDTSGAGDVFNGTLAAELAAGATLLDAVRVAVQVASMSTLTPGARLR